MLVFMPVHIPGIIIAFLAVVVFVVGVIFWPKRLSPPESALPILPPAATTTRPNFTEQNLGGLAPKPPAVGAVVRYNGSPVAELPADPQVLKQIPAETYEQSRLELAELALKLAENPRRSDDWMRVAFIKRFYHDYLGARDAYEYLNRIDESNALPFYNLGGLYGYYLKEPQKAVSKYRAAVARDPVNVSYYLGLADFYRDVLDDFAAAEAVLREGQSKSPDVSFNIALGAIYSRMGSTTAAITHYERALASGDLVGGQREAIQKEIQRLRALP